MHPAFSVIFFTVFSGAGYGLIGVLGFAVAYEVLTPTRTLGIVGLGLGLAAVSAGLLASTWHLGHPERAWRAFSQWRTSWLSREGVAAVVTYAPVLGLAYFWIFEGEGASEALRACGLLSAAGAVVTVACTGMIYRSLKTIHQWHNSLTVPCYLLAALASGAAWLNAVATPLGAAGGGLGVFTAGALAAAWAAKLSYWRRIDTTTHAESPETATGLGRFGKVTKFEGPHTADNYLLKEMGYQVARKHAHKLRRYAEGLAFGLPIALIALGLGVDGALAAFAAVMVALSVTVGLLIERWLFFAEARHVVVLYYGADVA